MNTEEQYNLWVTQNTLNSFLRNDLAKMASDKELLNDAFYKELEFGTAGMRGLLGAGTNRLNEITVAKATFGLGKYLLETSASETKTVVIGYDSRLFSKDFAFVAAGVLGKLGINTFVFDELRPTPEISFAVRELGADAGIMITASHNPKNYNGYKVYGSDGGQISPEIAVNVVEKQNQISDIFSIPQYNLPELIETGFMQIIGEDIDELYLQSIKTVPILKGLPDRDKTQIAYSPLHGTGKIIGMRALRENGYLSAKYVVKQAIIDPGFSSVEFPNPEFESAFVLAKETGTSINADLLLVTDPDADRLGAAAKDKSGNYILLTGNQIASVVLNYILEQKSNMNELDKHNIIVKSIVSSELPAKIAESFDVETENVLTGFKYIAETIHKYELSHEKNFLFGFEESYGFLSKPFVRDKDAIQMLVLLSEAATYYKAQGLSLYEELIQLFEKYGYFVEKTISLDFPGESGSAKIGAIMQQFKENPPSEFAGHKIIKTADFERQLEINNLTGEQSKLNLPKANVLKYYLDDETWIAIRPSGTEPKIKFYVGVIGASMTDAQNKLSEITTEINKQIN